MPSVSSPPAVSLKDIIEQEQSQDTSNVDPVTEVCPFVLLCSINFIRSA